MLYFKYDKPTVVWTDAHFHPCEVKKKRIKITVSILKEKTLFMKIMDITLLFVVMVLCVVAYICQSNRSEWVRQS